MKPKRIILIRHGESEGNADKRIYGIKPDFALLLTDKGKAQAAAAGEQLRRIVQKERMQLYVSPLFRTRQTFRQLVAGFPGDQYTWQEEPRLREQEWGHLRTLEQCAVIDREREAYGTFYYRIPDGESAADVYDRVSDFFHTLFRDFEKDNYPPNAVMVTHGMAIRMFLMRWFHYTVEEFETYANPPNCAIVIMELQDNGKYVLTTTMRKRPVAHNWRLEE